MNLPAQRDKAAEEYALAMELVNPEFLNCKADFIAGYDKGSAHERERIDKETMSRFLHEQRMLAEHKRANLLVEALSWFWDNWGTSKENIREQGYAMARVALAAYESAEQQEKEGGMSKMWDDRSRLEKQVDKVRLILSVHQTSTTPMDAYHTGMFNGIECALAILDEREAKYLDVEKPAPPTERGDWGERKRE